MQVAEILVRRTIRFVFFGGEGKKGPAAKEKSSKVEKKRRKEEKRTFHAGRRGFVTFSLSLSLSLVHFFRYFSSEPPLLGFLKDFVCKKKRKKGTRLVIGRRRPMGSLDFFFAWLFYLSTRETFVCSVFFRFPFIFQRRLGLAVGDVAKPIRSLVSLGVFYGLGQWNCVNNERPSKEQLDKTKKLGTFVSTSGANDFQSRPR